MGLMDKLQFWKRNDDFMDSELKPLSGPEFNPQPMAPPPDFGNQPLPGSDLGLGAAASPSGLPPMQSMQPSPVMGPPPGMQNPNPYGPPPNDFGQQQFQSRPVVPYREINPMPQQPAMNQPLDLHKEIELLSSKIDTLRAMLENINTRLGHIETLEEKKYKW